MSTTEKDPGRFLVEWYGPHVCTSPVAETAGRLNDGAASIAALGSQVQLLTILAVPAEDYVFGVFAAESAETVARVCADADVPATRISAAVGWPDIATLIEQAGSCGAAHGAVAGAEMEIRL
jgi:hypothetical protein